MSQNTEILSYLKTGATLTPLKALKEFGCLRLSGRIYNLREAGWPVVCDNLDVGNGKRVGHYTLDSNRELWPSVQ